MSEHDEGAAAEAVRRLAEAVASDDGPTVVALLADPEAQRESWRQAGRLCDAVASRRRTLVVNLAGAGSGFDEFLGVEAGNGLEGVRAGRIKLSEAPVQIEGRRFLYLPAGRPDPAAADAPLPLEDAGVVGAVEKLAEKIRQAGGTLLLYLTPDALPDRRTAELMDGAVRLAGAVAVGGVPTLGHLDLGDTGPDASVEDFLGLPDEPEGGRAEEPAADDGEAEEPAPEPTSAAEAAAAPSDPEPGGEAEPAPGAHEAERTGSETLEPTPAEARPGTSPAGDAAAAGPLAGYGEPEATEPTAATGQEPDGTGGATEPAGDGPAGEAEPARVLVRSGSADDGDDGGWRRHRRTSGVPWGKIALGAMVALGLAAGWWTFADRAASGDGAPAAGDPSMVRSAEAAGGDGAGPTDGDGAPADAGGDTASGEAAGAALALVEASPELSHSVLVASFASWPAARERLDRWSGENGAPVLFAAPTPIDDRVYWRIFAGALGDPAAGPALNRALVRRGWKDGASAWDVRPASLAFRVAVETSREAARRRVEELHGRELPAYVLPAAARGDTAWAVWSGAYESRDAAAGLGERLRSAGVEAELVTRRGTTGTP